MSLSGTFFGSNLKTAVHSWNFLGPAVHFKIGVGRLSSSGVLSAFCKTLVGNSIIISVKGYGDIIEDKNTFWKSIEISASVFPLVSGTALAMKTKPVVQNTLF